MRELTNVVQRTFAAAWLAVLVFMALAKPADALVAGEGAAGLLQLAGALLVGGWFALRKPLRRTRRRAIAYLERSQGLGRAALGLVETARVGGDGSPSEQPVPRSESGWVERARAALNPGLPGGVRGATVGVVSNGSPSVRKLWPRSRRRAASGPGSAATAGTSLRTAATRPPHSNRSFPQSRA